MRLLCEIFIIGALLYVGWDKPFRSCMPWNSNTVAKAPAVTSQPIVSQPVTATPRSGAWMYDPNRQGPLDTPAPHQHIAAHPQPSASIGGSWMFDPNHRSPLDPSRRTATPH